MSPQDILLTIAQLGVAVAGFSGIVAALAKPSHGDFAANRSLLNVLVAASGGVVLWALIPLLLLSAELSERTTWMVSSAGWSLHQTVAMAYRAYRIRRSPEEAPAILPIAPFILGGTLCALTLQIANAAWLGVAWPLLVGLVWWLLFTFVIFVRLIHVASRDV